jgi:ABC-type bacteriocin/lantibiotic exporter with double-glycine peptidase domain
MRLRVIVPILLLSAVVCQARTSAESGGALIDVPFFAQSSDGCGSAAIAMIMTYWFNKGGQAVPVSAEPAEIQAALFSAKDAGIRASDMQHYFESHGFRAFAFEGSWKDLRHHLELGRPLIVSLRTNGRHEPLHYAVVVGIDWERDYVFLNDPAQQKMLRVSWQGFESEWSPVHHWTLLVVPQESD